MATGGALGYLLGTGLGDMLRSDPRVSELFPEDAVESRSTTIS